MDNPLPAAAIENLDSFYKLLRERNGRLTAEEIDQIASLPAATLMRLQEDTAYLIILEILAAGKNAREKLVPTEGISFDEFHLLALIHRAETLHPKDSSPFLGLSQLAISKHLSLSSSTISALIDRMDVARTERDSSVRPWVKRTENPDNRREKLIALTREGTASFRLARKDYKAQLRKALISNLNLEQLLAIRYDLFCFNVVLNPKHDPTGGEATDEPSTP